MLTRLLSERLILSEVSDAARAAQETIKLAGQGSKLSTETPSFSFRSAHLIGAAQPRVLDGAGKGWTGGRGLFPREESPGIKGSAPTTRDSFSIAQEGIKLVAHQ
jgi:hypothetical protein